LRVIRAYRTGCAADGSSVGLELDVEITGYEGKLLSAGAATNADPDPLVAINIRPATNDWRHVVALAPLGGMKDRVAAGTIRIQFGMATVPARTALLSQPLSVVVSAAGPASCMRS
jgi:hypothetical protein